MDGKKLTMLIITKGSIVSILITDMVNFKEIYLNKEEHYKMIRGQFSKKTWQFLMGMCLTTECHTMWNKNW